MKIAILSMYSGHIDRGVETWTREIANRFSKRHKVLVLQGEDEKKIGDYEVKKVGVNISWKLRTGENWWSEYLTGPYWIFLNLSFTLRSIPHLIKFQPDVVMPANGGVQALIVRISSLIFGWRMAVVGHAGIGAPEKWNLLMRPDLYIMPSIRGKKWARKLFFSKGINIIKIPHGIDLEKFGKTDNKIKINLEKPIILCVASFDPFKRVDLAVKAVSKLDKVSLLVLGGDRSSGKVDGLGKKLLGRRYLRIKVKPSEMPGYYAASDVFTLPSNHFEAFGIVYLEALASNLAVVATNDELRKEIVGGAGILVEPTDVDAYADALKYALQKDWGDIPRKQAEKFDWEKIINRYEEEFEKLVN